MRIPIDRESKEPLYVQVRDALRTLIIDGTLAPGSELPASRILARTLDVNRGTVTLAYDELVTLGYLYRHVGRGTFVSARIPDAPKKDSPAPTRQRLRWEEKLAFDPHALRDPILVEVARLAAQPGVVSFAGGHPDPVLFPLDDFRKALNAALKEDGRKLLGYGGNRGSPEFVELLRRILIDRGIAAQPDELLVVNGSQQGIDLVARLLVGPGDTVVVEDPSYHGALAVFRALGARLVGVPVDEEGLDVGALERLLERERPKLLYTMPSFQNPTGVRLSLARRKKLVALAARHDLPILEDDFKGDMGYEGEELPPLRALAEGRDVIYAGTFSKMLFPGIRLGWLVAPAPLVQRLSLAKANVDLSSSLIFQAAMLRFAKGTRLARHAERVRAEYRKRRDALLAALEAEMPRGTTWTRPVGGFSLTVRVPVDAAELLPRAAERGVVYSPGRVFSVSGDANILRLSFGGLRVEQVKEGVKRLAMAVKEARVAPLRAAAAPV
ncbi:MAG TPA: PLP-dependent aminotransferase family protein [Planctomycetota bacterium]|nr:PLP-dependent aminotransferase family protein [Planctomycetota bacterium]